MSSEFLRTEPADRDWLIEDWIPKKTVCSLYGVGGTGKSLIAIQLMHAIAGAKPWFGMTCPEPGPVLGYFCEDDKDELHRRNNAVAGNDLVKPEHERPIFVPRLGKDNALVTFNEKGQVERTAFYDLVEADIAKYRPKLVILDTLSDVFTGNENDRHQVKAFVAQALGSLCLAYDTTILVLAHPSRSGEQGDGTSGSTAWNGSVRARMLFRHPEQPVDGNHRQLILMKGNYGPAGDDTNINVRWQNGAFQMFDPRAIEDEEIRNLTPRVRDLIAQKDRDGHRITGFTKPAGNPMDLYLSKAEMRHAKAATELLQRDGIVAKSKGNAKGAQPGFYLLSGSE